VLGRYLAHTTTEALLIWAIPVQNLLSNALKFRCRQGRPTIKVSAGVVVEKAGDGGLAAPPREFARLTVSDDGIGFDPRYAERIFGVFQRLHTREEYSGSGIGLAVCRRVAERHHGRITAASTPGQGATFTVLLPVTQPREETGHDQVDPTDPDPGGR
jgi:two-component system CheB/CheR fusion protein